MRLLAVIALAACGDNLPQPADARPEKPPDASVLPRCANPVAGTKVSIRKIADVPGETPVLVTAPAADPKLFVVTRDGTIRIIHDERLLERPFFDIKGTITARGERGLLGLAFHPQYHANGTFFVYYLRGDEDRDFPIRDVVVRCQRRSELIADQSTCVEILAIKDTSGIHNGGMIEFGPDGYLYIGTGDGGIQGDPNNNAQSLTDGVPNPLTIALQGKLLRIDVDRRDPGKEYAVPPDNPFVTSGAPEVYALGFRNPWRWSFDRVTGDIWIGDVGHTAFEELDFVKAGQLAGTNFGWPMWEASTCFRPPCTTDGMMFPQVVRPHVVPDLYTCIIGGQVYRGTCYPDLLGKYFFANHTERRVAMAVESEGVVTVTDLTPPPGETFPEGISSIHEAATGELYVTTIEQPDGTPGAVHRIEVVP